MNGNTGFNRVYCLFMLLLSAVSLALPGMQERQKQAAKTRPVGRLSAQQVLSLAEPLCRTVTARSEPLTLTAEALHIEAHDFWSVRCLDASGQDLVSSFARKWFTVTFGEACPVRRRLNTFRFRL